MINQPFKMKLLQTAGEYRLNQIRDDYEFQKAFTDDASNILDEVEELCLELETKRNDKEIISRIFGLIHTIKGSSGFFQPRDFHDYLHRFEDLLSRIQNREIVVTKKIISICLNAIEVSKKFVHDFKMDTHGKYDLENLTKMFDFNKFTDEIEVKQSPKENKDFVSGNGIGIELRKVQASSIIKSISRIIRGICSDLNKEVDFIVEGDEFKIDKFHADIILISLVHMVRNSIDHGIEDAPSRLEKKKPLTGKLLLKLSEDLEFVKVELKDDGAGLDVEKIKEKILQKKIRTTQELADMDIDDIFAIIFESGFSTAQDVTPVSGRGMGMSMVKKSVENAGGKIIINSKKDDGSHFTLMIPIRKSGLSI